MIGRRDKGVVTDRKQQARRIVRHLSLRDMFPRSLDADDKTDSLNSFRSRLVWLSWVRLAMLMVLAVSTMIFSRDATGTLLDSIRGFLMWFTIVSMVPASLYFPLLMAVRAKRSLQVVAVVQIVQDTLFAAVMVAATGGSGSGFTFFFPLMIIVAGLVLGRAGSVIGIVISSLLLLVIALWETGFLPMPGFVNFILIRGNFEEVFYAYVLNLIAFIVVALLSSFLVEQTRKSESQKEAYRIDLEDLRVLHETIISSLDTGLITLALDGTILHLNRAAEQLLRVNMKSVRNHPFREVLPELNRPLEDVEGEIDIARISDDGSSQYFQIAVKPLLSGRWQMVGRLIRIQNVTEIRHMEEQRKADERLTTIGKLSAVVAHEIRNPLASISASAQMVSMSESVSPDDRKALDIVVKETDHLNEWISELLDYARPSKGGTTEFDLAESIVHSVHFVRNLPGAESIEIETNLQPGITLKGDPQRFSRIVLNIAKNAIEAMDGKGLIVVRSYKVIKGDSYEVIVDITNDGPPIPTEELERIFEAFYTTKARGTGLGLTTVIQICEDFNATLDVVSSESQGTVFTVHIPV